MLRRVMTFSPMLTSASSFGTRRAYCGRKESLLKHFYVKRICPSYDAVRYDLIESDNRQFVGVPDCLGDRPPNFGVQLADLIIAVGARLDPGICRL